MIDYHHLKARPFAPVHQTVAGRDVMLYALSLGMGQDPLDEAAIGYVYEGAPGGLKVLPTLAVVLGYPGFWASEPDTGIDWVRMVHGEQRMVLHAALPSEGAVIGHNRITHVIDKGPGKGAMVVIERRLETAHGEPLATLAQVNFCRGDGGYSQSQGGQRSDEALPALPAVPSGRPPDWIDDQTIRPEAALLYRLLADRNPLHADPRVATAAGFPRPILHGLASYGLVCRALLRQCAGDDPVRLRSLDLRFAAPVYPGETLRTEIWRDGDFLRFQGRVLERELIVLSHGQATLA